MVRICTLVEGTPLGLEVAASWIRDLGPAEPASALEESLDTLDTTMRDVTATIEVFGRYSILPGGC